MKRCVVGCVSVWLCGCWGVDEPVSLGATASAVMTASTAATHHSHLQTSTWHRTLACPECHDPHKEREDGGTRVDFGPFASTKGTTPSWNGMSCSGVYCHGAGLQPGGTNTTPTWSIVDGTQAACGTCHGLPPGGTHPPLSSLPPTYRGFACAFCHSPVVGLDGGFVNPSLHINGAPNFGVPPCSLPCP